MSNSKVGVVVAAAVGTAFLALAGCASQGSAASPVNVPNSCQTVTQNTCKGQASCKGYTSHKHKKMKKHSAPKTTVEKTTTESTSTETSVEAK